MAGPRTTEFLAASTYADFYELAHAFSELILASLVGIENYAAVVIIWSQQSPTALGPAPVEARAAALRAAARQCVDDIRQCFWPDRNWRVLNESRWFPYDARAWDRFFGEVAHVLRSHLDQLADGIQQVQAAGDSDARNGDPYAAWHCLALIAVTAYQQLQMVVTTVGFEARMFRQRPPAWEPSDR
jgi:hypothetical protein